jgi:hypothetical protein
MAVRDGGSERHPLQPIGMDPPSTPWPSARPRARRSAVGPAVRAFRILLVVVLAFVDANIILRVMSQDRPADPTIGISLHVGRGLGHPDRSEYRRCRPRPPRVLGGEPRSLGPCSQAFGAPSPVGGDGWAARFETVVPSPAS